MWIGNYCSPASRPTLEVLICSRGCGFSVVVAEMKKYYVRSVMKDAMGMVFWASTKGNRGASLRRG